MADSAQYAALDQAISSLAKMVGDINWPTETMPIHD